MGFLEHKRTSRTGGRLLVLGYYKLKKKKIYCKVSFYNLIQSCRPYLVMAPIKMLVMCREFYLKYIGSLVAVCCEVD